MVKEKIEFQVYNTMTKQKEFFIPKEPGKVKMYVCGVTSYDFSHIGHARAYVAFDVLYRYLKYLGYDVVYVRNFTDVDDKIIKRANETGEDPIALSGRFCQEFLKDMDDLQCLLPTHQPRVTDHMEQIKEMIAKIITNGCAYTINGDVYFSVDSFPEYGRLSGRKLEDNRAGERVAVDSRKRNAADFALWKAAKPGEPSWESPWGPGRPGWHIECSAMSAQYLTHSFDIHGGGMDLTFPHHENEIAQSCAACPESNISYWMHNGFVTIDDEKMSKSLGNFFTIREVTRLYHPIALRYFLLGMHYRSPVNYSISQIEIASESVFYLYQTLLDCEEALSVFQQGTETETEVRGVRVSPQAQECIKKLRNELETKLSDDLHTPTILNAALQEALRLMNSSLNMLKKKQQKKQQLSAVLSLAELLKEVKAVLDVLGLLSSSTCAEVLQQFKERALKRAELTEEDILHAIEERTLARKNKEFARSDQIRSDLVAKGIALMDIGTETVWRPCVRPEPEQPAAPAQQEQSAAAVQKEKPVAPSQQKQSAAAPQKEQPVAPSQPKQSAAAPQKEQPAAPLQQEQPAVPPQ
ncbi:PREDICTED: cysteine--tRNA ligase 2, cytoplasmic [Nicotiana attenuata]|uniref:cysteine--tRNA ligase n=1 Tax=Nicotiana attenuata TaxID=49451 RepID=A0A1J6HTM3_NICAT|nr:PREDICTED: cysteine--tRNA ligase 2, cytoplasmic [Nicotiana attenuata]XP_019256724.1 PREDICTED: cysteine--tRNA ligase 2, cytoplasmic [Nicotiana attenuata]OIS95691.1 cysteine--trna ligase 2, cytoplasmic [Nicotiana attenuata]